jgi:MFS family permease
LSDTVSDTATGTPSTDNASRGRATRAAFVGTVLEYYDFTLYGSAAAAVFGPVFLTGASPAVATLQSMATFAVGFLVRPIAGTFLGGIGDRFGRRRILFLTLILMGGATFLIGLLPGHAQIGAWAPVLLIVLRVVQGIGASAEYSGATVVAVEFARADRRGLFGALPSSGSSFGGLLGALAMLAAASATTTEQFLAWGWRIPFLFSAVLVTYALWLRLHLPETPAFQRLAEQGAEHRTPIRDVVRQHPRPLIAVALVLITQAGLGYFYLVFMVSYAAENLGLARQQTFLGLVCAQLGSTLAYPFWGWLSDRVGRAPVLWFGLAFSAAMGFLAFPLVGGGMFAGYTVAMVLGSAVGVGAIFAVIGTMLTERLPAGQRFAGLGLGRETGNAIGAAVVPLLAVAFAARPGTLALSLLVLVTAAAGAVGALLLPRAPLDQE